VAVAQQETRPDALGIAAAAHAAGVAKADSLAAQPKRPNPRGYCHISYRSPV